MWTDFVMKLQSAQDARDSDMLLFLNPRLDKLPLPITRYDDPFLPFGKAIVSATQDIVCGYVFDLASYLAMGAATAIALERTIRFVDNNSVTILHGPFSGFGYSAMADVTGFGADAITVTGQTELDYYLHNPPYAAFMIRHAATDMAATPEQGGFFYPDETIFTLRANADSILQVHLTNDAILFAGRADDFAQQVRAAIKEMR